MKFGEDLCAIMRVEKGKIINSDTPLKINNLNIKPIIEEDTCKHLDQDKNITYSGPVKEIWKSELSALNKQITHNCFVVLVLTPWNT